MKNDARRFVEVAGDVCLDVLGVPKRDVDFDDSPRDNWQLTGETRTYYLPGGSLLIAELLRGALGDSASVRATTPCLPEGLQRTGEPLSPLTPEAFARLGERLTRDEIVHSLLAVDFFPKEPAAKTRDCLRVAHTHGFSGPRDRQEPSLPLLPPASDEGTPDVVVLDDTGNRFRRSPDQWPASLTTGGEGCRPWIIYKLHRPLPTPPSNEGVGTANRLWELVRERHAERRVVIVSIDDFRDLEAPISRGLSWERTALDLVWQLLNVERFAALCDVPHLIVRFGLDGALYWRGGPAEEGGQGPDYRAWLIYDPHGIEGSAENECAGRMVGYASAFVAAVARRLLLASPEELGSLASRAEISPCLCDGVRDGLAASRRLLQQGFGVGLSAEPAYPTAALFERPWSSDGYFACQPVPIIRGAAEPDRGFWRLLDSIFEGRTPLLHRAVALAATGTGPADEDDRAAAELLRQAPLAVFAKALRTHDRREIENYRALYALFRDYVARIAPPRPLSVAVFGPPGAGKSFGVKQVAKSLEALRGPRPIEPLTFNLSQYRSPDELADAFHRVRDSALRQRIPLVFFDEFDTALAGTKLGWLRYFLAPMQDGEFLDRGTPHPIGQAIFVFAGGTCGTYEEFARPLARPKTDQELEAFRDAKGPDFLSRLRGTLDVPGLDLNASFDPYGSTEAFPCEAAILLRRAGIFAHQLGEKAPQLRDARGGLRVGPTALRALLHLPRFEHGNRSFEALLDMSRLDGAEKLTPSMLPPSGHVGLHADAAHLSQLLSAEYPFPTRERELIAQSIHRCYVELRRKHGGEDAEDESLRDWEGLSPDLQESNRRQADDLARKLRSAGLWFRKRLSGATDDPRSVQKLTEALERLAQAEHDRWVAEKRRQGWSAARSQNREDRNNALRLHNFLYAWDELSEEGKQLDREPVRQIPRHLAAAGYELVDG